MDHDHIDNRSEKLVATEDLRRGDRDQDRQKRQRRVGKQIQKLVDIGLGHPREDLYQTTQQTV